VKSTESIYSINRSNVNGPAQFEHILNKPANLFTTPIKFASLLIDMNFIGRQRRREPRKIFSLRVHRGKIISHRPTQTFPSADFAEGERCQSLRDIKKHKNIFATLYNLHQITRYSCDFQFNSILLPGGLTDFLRAGRPGEKIVVVCVSLCGSVAKETNSANSACPVSPEDRTGAGSVRKKY
jgi:hypothetical protein